MERTHIEYEKIRDKYEKLVREFERLKQTSQVNISTSNLSIAEKNEVERMREALDKALQVRVKEKILLSAAKNTCFS